MDFNQYQEAAKKTCVSPFQEHMIFGLLEEAGELSGIYKRIWRGDVQYASEYDELNGLSDYAYGRLKAEMGDVLWYLAMLADTLGFKFEEIASANITKLEERQKRNVILGSGNDR